MNNAYSRQCAILKNACSRRGRVRDIAGGVTAPAGFRIGTAQCGIKYQDRDDLALIVSDCNAVCAGMFTTNRVKGAPVIVSREHVKSGSARAIVANSGNANVCNGEVGLEAAVAMTRETASQVGCDPDDVLVASTGVIGREFPIKRALAGIPAAYSKLTGDSGTLAARAIMTTDTVPKETAIEFEAGDMTVRIGAMAKGSGMISPNMATMFCFITTDASIEPNALRKALRYAVEESFNCITVDGDMSTSDTVIVLANGMAGNSTLKSRSKAFDAFTEGLNEVCLRMAKAIVRDGEGATKFVTVRVTDAAGKDDARQVGLAIANSPLVKTACFGNDPNWGRIICATGYSGVPVDENHLVISMNGTLLYDAGRVIPLDDAEMRKSLAGTDIDIEVSLGMGKAESVLYTTDMTYDYIRINAEYTT